MTTTNKRAAIAGLLAVGLLTAAAVPAMASAGSRTTGSQVPWSKVGPGWELVQYDTSTGTGVGIPNYKPGPVTLYLVNPAGRRYAMYRWRAGQAPRLLDWAGDKTRALLLFPPNKLSQLTLRTGKLTSIPIAGMAPGLSAAYTRPAGRDVIAPTGTGRVLSLFSLHGQKLRSLDSGSAIQSATGSQFGLAAANGLTLTTSSGHLIRQLPVPGTSGGCGPIRYWNASTILASCVPTSRSGPTAIRLWLVPTTGKAPHALTPAHISSSRILGLADAWKLNSGLFLQAIGACGSEFIARQHLNRSISVVHVPGTNGQHDQIVTATANSLLVQAGTGCGGSTALLTFNPATHLEHWLMKPPHNQFGVEVVITYYSRANQPVLG